MKTTTKANLIKINIKNDLLESRANLFNAICKNDALYKIENEQAQRIRLLLDKAILVINDLRESLQ